MKKVNIITSDRGWILEKLASEITSRLPYAIHTDEPSADAAINYYITYSCWKEKVSEVEIGYFAHLEPFPEARKKFFQVAQNMDYCVCHSELYANILRDEGIKNTHAIAPGVDLGEFDVKLKIGVVGRTYHTGRKGEHIVSKVMDIPNIEWHFTGDGWPKAALNIPDGQMADFYHSMDYILIPALYEGGPMSVVESLATGTEIIAPPIGWVPEFPHIEFPVGDVAALRQVLIGLIEKKQALRESVLSKTWENWAIGHDELFQRLMPKQPKINFSASSEQKKELGVLDNKSIALVMHGSEVSTAKNASKGGPSVRIPKLNDKLNELGFNSEINLPTELELSKADIVHGFNVWHPKSSKALFSTAKKLGKPYVFSSIFLDLSERPLWEAIPGIMDKLENVDDFENVFDEFKLAFRLKSKAFKYPTEPEDGYFSTVREIVQGSETTILLSKKEKQLLESIDVDTSNCVIVHNPVPAPLNQNVDPNLFSDTYGVKNYVLCVGRIETRKNQILLANALRDTDIDLVLVGHTASPQVKDLVEKQLGDRVHFIGRLDPSSDMLASAFLGAKVFALPSWSEGAPLAALEAASLGCNMVLSDRAGEQEYFGDLALYCDPSSVSSIRTQVLAAFNKSESVSHNPVLIKHVSNNFNWNKHSTDTIKVYENAITKNKTDSSVNDSTLMGKTILYDVTTSINRSGRWTGISRVEMSLAKELEKIKKEDIRFIYWDNNQRQFYDLPACAIEHSSALKFHASLIKKSTLIESDSVTPGSQLIVAGSAWMQNSLYAQGIVKLVSRLELYLTPIIYDLVPFVAPYWFDDGYAPVFKKNYFDVIGSADHILTISQNTKKDIEKYSEGNTNVTSSVHIFRVGDEINKKEVSTEKEALDLSESSLKVIDGKEFILCVGAIHSRKNPSLLYNAWKILAQKKNLKCPHLVIVGGVAWNGQDVAKAMKEDVEVNKYIHILSDITDIELDWLYSNCMFTVYPSLYEGWGLPVAESLLYGKHCLTSDNSSTVEIAPSLVTHISPLDPVSWATQIQFFTSSKAARDDKEKAIREEYKPYLWKDSAQEILDISSKLYCPKVKTNFYQLNDVLSFSSLEPASGYLNDGWYSAERWGCWSKSTHSSISFSLAKTKQDEDAFIIINLKSMLSVGQVKQIKVLANQKEIGVLTVLNSKSQTYILPIDLRGVIADTLKLDFISNYSCVISSIKGGNDARDVSIGLEKLAIASASDAYRVITKLKPAHQFDLPQFLSADNFSSNLKGEWNTTQLGVWPKKTSSYIEFEAFSYPVNDLELSLILQIMASNERQHIVQVIINSIKTEQFLIADGCVQDLRIKIPLSLRWESNVIQVQLNVFPSDSEQVLDSELNLGLISASLATVENTTPLSLIEAGKERCDWGDIVSFSNEFNELHLTANQFSKAGFYPADSGGCWISGNCAKIFIPLKTVYQNEAFYLSISACTYDRGSDSSVLALINGTSGELIEHDEKGFLYYFAEGVVAENNIFMLEIITSNAVVISQKNIEADDRHTQLFIERLQIQKDFEQVMYQPTWKNYAHYNLGDVIAHDMNTYFIEGWHNAEASGRWSSSSSAVVAMQKEKSLSSKLLLTINCIAKLKKGSQKVEGVINVNNIQEEVVIFEDQVMQNIQIQINSSDIISSPYLVVELLYPDPVAPSATGESADNRVLGYHIKDIQISECE
ncbi:glycosyltransferase [Pseudoalteromonas agarivorans]|uniref:glycosyltransferase n=1 Tax=Pseudoalteromonas agarivorans TaxID=176102 RepID=UPI00311DBBFC